MDKLGTIAAVIGAVVAIISLIFSVRNSKGNILKGLKIRKINKTN